MIEKIKEHIANVEKFQANAKDEIEQFRIQYLGKKGILNECFAAFKTVANEDKKAFGQIVNELKSKAEAKAQTLRDALEEARESKGVYGDLTRPEIPLSIGARHPISLVKNQIVEIFSNIGFNVSEGPEIEDDWHNFTALNLPEYHPARDMQDTFFIQTNPDILLRTHTSSVQVRYMETTTPPYEPFHRGVYFVTKPFRHVRTVCSIKWKVCTSTKMFRLPI